MDFLNNEHHACMRMCTHTYTHTHACVHAHVCVWWWWWWGSGQPQTRAPGCGDGSLCNDHITKHPQATHHGGQHSKRIPGGILDHYCDLPGLCTSHPSPFKNPQHSQSQAGRSAGLTERRLQETKQAIAQFDNTALLSTSSDTAPWAVLWVGGLPLWVGGQPHPYPKWCLVGGWVDPPSAKKHLGGWVVWDVFSWGPPP